jgi:hypothetical protein
MTGRQQWGGKESFTPELRLAMKLSIDGRADLSRIMPISLINLQGANHVVLKLTILQVTPDDGICMPSACIAHRLR